MSYAQLPASAVVRACNSYIKAREARVLKERTELIESQVGRRDWFGFGRPATREDIEEEFADELSWIEITGGMWYNRIQHLLSLATVAEKLSAPVMVDKDLGHLLKSHF